MRKFPWGRHRERSVAIHTFLFSKRGLPRFARNDAGVKRFIFFACFILLSAYTRVGEPMLSDAAQEARARELFSELRCVVCAGESIADSNAELAKTMRDVVREKVKAGESDRAIMEYFTERYGESVRFRPVLSFSTLFLWCAPLMVLLLGGVWFFFSGKRQK